MLGNVVAAVGDRVRCRRAARARWWRRSTGFRGLEHVMEPVGRRRRRHASSTTRRRRTSKRRAGRSKASPRSSGRDRGWAVQGRRLRASCVRPLAARGRAVVAIGEAAPLVREALARSLPVIDAASMREAVERGYERRGPTASCCSRQRARASTGSATTRSAGRAFKEEVASGSEARNRGVSSEQSSVGRRGWEPTAGNADYPGLRGGCPTPRAD